MHAQFALPAALFAPPRLLFCSDLQRWARKAFLMATACSALCAPALSADQPEIRTAGPTQPSAGSLQLQVPASAATAVPLARAAVSPSEPSVQETEPGAPAIATTIEGINFDEDGANG